MAAETIKSWGLQPVIGPHTNNLNVNAYAGTADERAADLLWALEDDSIKAMLCSRGGYGSIHLLNRIPQETYRQHPKWFIGHGDITMLLYDVVGAGVMSIHGPMAFQIAGSQEPASSITRDILSGILPQYIVPANPYNRVGHAEGVPVGSSSCIPLIEGASCTLDVAADQSVLTFNMRGERKPVEVNVTGAALFKESDL